MSLLHLVWISTNDKNQFILSLSSSLRRYTRNTTKEKGKLFSKIMLPLMLSFVWSRISSISPISHCRVPIDNIALFLVSVWWRDSYLLTGSESMLRCLKVYRVFCTTLRKKYLFNKFGMTMKDTRCWLTRTTI